MAINFPTSPSLNAIHTENNLSWKYNGNAWLSVATSNTDSVVATGSTQPRSLSDRFADAISVKDFGAVGDGTTDDAAAIQATLNSQTDGGIVYFPQGTYLCNSKITTTNHVSLVGEGAKSTEIIFASTDGILIDRSSTGNRDDSILIKNLSILCKTLGTKVGLEVLTKESAAPKAAKVAIYNCSFHGFDTTNINTNNYEWLTAIKLNSADKAVLHDVFIYGKELSSQANFNTDTKGIEIINASGVCLYKCDIYRVKTGVRVTGQSEGLNIVDGVIVAVDVGIRADNCVNPSNNHSIRGVHIAAEQYGIDIQANTDSSLSGYHNISNCFLLQRHTQGSRANNSNNFGMTGYQAMRLSCKGSTVDNISILSNLAPPAWATNTLYRVGNSVQSNGNIYECTSQGTSASSGSGLSGTGSSISSGTSTFSFIKTALANACTVDASSDNNKGIIILAGSHNHISNITAQRAGTTIQSSNGTDNFITSIVTNTADTNGTVVSILPNVLDIVLGNIEGGDDSNIVHTAVKHTFKTQGGEVLTLLNGNNPAATSLEIFGSSDTNDVVTLRTKDNDAPNNPNLDIKLETIGTGKVRFGTHTSTSDTAVSGFIEIKDKNGNVRKLAVIS